MVKNAIVIGACNFKWWDWSW